MNMKCREIKKINNKEKWVLTINKTKKNIEIKWQNKRDIDNYYRNNKRKNMYIEML